MDFSEKYARREFENMLYTKLENWQLTEYKGAQCYSIQLPQLPTEANITALQTALWGAGVAEFQIERQSIGFRVCISSVDYEECIRPEVEARNEVAR